MEAVVPAHLSFFAIYNPSLSQNDETVQDQVLYYYSHKSVKTRKAQSTPNEVSLQNDREEQNEKLRQIGLAQGMVEFAKYELISSLLYKPILMHTTGHFQMENQ